MIMTDQIRFISNESVSDHPQWIIFINEKLQVNMLTDETDLD